MGNPGRTDLPVKGGGPTRVGDVLEGLLEGQGLGTQIRRMAAVDLWADAAGEQIAQVTRARTVVASTLFVEVRSSAWLTELSFMKNALVERVNTTLEKDGAIDGIVFTLMEGER